MNALSFPRKTSSRRGLLRARATLSVLGALLIFGLAAGCAHAPVNQPLTVRDQDRGYRFSTTPPKAPNTDEVFIILALSGGGTRAAAFSYGAMEKLAATTFTHDGVKRSLLDEVDVISSVSGGSFTAAYYGLHRDPAAFAQFPERFLYPKIRTGLALSLLNPINWPRLASPYYSRIDMAVDYYDRHVFDHQTFGDLAAIGQRPFIVLNATDMSLSSRFEFTQADGEHIRPHSEVALQIAVSLRPVEKPLNDEQGPPCPDDLECSSEVAHALGSASGFIQNGE